MEQNLDVVGYEPRQQLKSLQYKAILASSNPVSQCNYGDLEILAIEDFGRTTNV